MRELEMLELSLITLSVFRIYLEVLRFDFMKLPLSRRLAKCYGRERIEQFHKFGFIMGVGYFLLHGPGLLF